jgi:hypothetical protein
MIEKEDDDEVIPASKQSKIVITSSGRVAKRPKDVDMYNVANDDDEEEVEEEEDYEEESEYGGKDVEFQIDSDVSFETECFNYDQIKK